MNQQQVMKLLATKEMKRSSWYAIMRRMEKQIFENDNLALIKLHSQIKTVLNKLPTQEVIISESDDTSEQFAEDLCVQYIGLFTTSSEEEESQDQKNTVNIRPN